MELHRPKFNIISEGMQIMHIDGNDILKHGTSQTEIKQHIRCLIEGHILFYINIYIKNHIYIYSVIVNKIYLLGSYPGQASL